MSNELLRIAELLADEYGLKDRAKYEILGAQRQDWGWNLSIARIKNDEEKTEEPAEEVKE